MKSSALVRCALSWCALLLTIPSASAQVQPRVLIAGGAGGVLASTWKKAGINAEAIPVQQLPTDASALALRCNVLVLMPLNVDAARQWAIEGFVRGGGGLWLDLSVPRSQWAGTWLEALSPTIALDERSTRLVQVSGTDAAGSPLKDLDFSSLPRLAGAQNVALPPASETELFNELSAWTFSKPLWHDQWQEWAFTSEPGRFSILSSARYGAGRTAAWGGGFGNAALLQWPGFKDFSTRILAWLAQGAPDGKILPPSPRSIEVRGFEPPAWWAGPLVSGLKGMGQNLSRVHLNSPPEALQEAGYTVSAGPADAALLFGTEASKPADAKIVFRLPAADEAKSQEDKPFDVSALTVVAAAKTAGTDAAPAATPLPAKIAATTSNLPTIGSAQPPSIQLPQQWRLAYTNDPDTKDDFKAGWANPQFSDAAWKPGPLTPQTTTLWGKPIGYDGAIWYRGTVNVPAESIAPDAALQLEANAQNLTLFVDGKQIALEPKKIVVPLSAIGGGQHLLAIRTFGELRSNRGLTKVTAVRLPLLWKPDPKHEGWTKGWNNLDADETSWLPVSNNFAEDPSGKDAMEGWVRFPVLVPRNAAACNVQLEVALNAQSVVFINGKPWNRRDFERVSRYFIPGSAFNAGRNVVAIWIRYLSSDAHSVNATVLPSEQSHVRTTISSPADGLGLRVRFGYPGKGGYRPPGFALRVNGKIAGGVVQDSNGAAWLYAAHALKLGENQVEITIPLTDDSNGAQVQAIEAVQPPAGMTDGLAGWVKFPREKATANWFDPQLNDVDWLPVDQTLAQDWRKVWVMLPVPDIADPGFVYRSHLRLTAEDLKRNFTLEVRSPAIQEILVNGRRILPDDEIYYSLNAALHEGDNVVAFAPARATWRNLDVAFPSGGRDRYAFLPELRGDRAPLVPGLPELAAYRINRTFRVAPLDTAPGAQVLFSWPNGSPAIALQGADGKKEIVAAPGVLDGLLPAPDLSARTKFSGAVSSIEYDYARRLANNGFQGDRKDQLLTALLAAAESGPALIADLGVQNRTANLQVRGTPAFAGEVSWRFLDWEGAYLGSGTTLVRLDEKGAGTAAIPLPDAATINNVEGASLGRFVRLRAVLLSADRREVLGFIDRHLSPTPPAEVVLRLDNKLDRLSTATAPVARRILHEALGGLGESTVYLPGETVIATALLHNPSPTPIKVTLLVTATPGLGGAPVTKESEITLLPAVTTPLEFQLPATATTREQPWKVVAELHLANQIVSHSERSFVVAAPRGDLKDYAEVMQQGRAIGGYMWSMTANSWPIEHLRGMDAQPASGDGPWWTRVRAGGDGNWAVAEGIHRGGGDGDQDGLLWGPFYDEYRGEIMDSFGWFPNGEPIRQWWGPYAQREPARRNGTRSSTFAVSDWWQYDAGYPAHSYSTLQMFNDWLVTHKGQIIGGKLLDGKPIVAPTLSAMLDIITRDYAPVFKFFQAEGLAHQARYTGNLMDSMAPGTGTSQLGQGSYANWLPGTIGGAALGPDWAKYENIGLLDADNHGFALDWQYSLETAVFRSLGIENNLLTQWERPQRYHRSHTAGVDNVPLDAPQWQRRQLDSRWQSIVDQNGDFQRVFNVSHVETLARDSFLIGSDTTNPNIGGGDLPAHWLINDKLANLAMTIGVKRPLSPLLVVGESDLDWVGFYQSLGELRDSGLKLGGAVSVAALDKLKPEDVTGLVWLPSRTADVKAISAIEAKVRAGVPLLMVGNVPEAPGSNLRQLLGVRWDPAGVDVTIAQGQSVAPALVNSSQARGLEQIPTPVLPINYTAAGITPLVTRDGKLVVGVNEGATLRTVFDAETPRIDRRDPAVQRIAVQSFQKLMNNRVIWPEGTGGYAFLGLDGKTYIVVENLWMTSREVKVTVAGPDRLAAANLLTGTALPASPAPGGMTVSLPLAARDGTVIVLSAEG